MKRLPDLAFGNAAADATSCQDLASESLACAIPSLTVVDARRDDKFLAKVSTRNIGQTIITSSSTLPCEMQVHDSQGWHLFVPYLGHLAVELEGSSVELSGGRNTLLLPNVRRNVRNDVRSAIAVGLDMKHLLGIMDVVAGNDPGSSKVEQRHHELDLRHGRELFPALQRICALIDIASADMRLAELLGLEEVLYRWIALVFDAQVGSAALPSNAHETKRLDIVCDLIRSTPERLITLTEMERISGMSARALQYAFKTRFGCSPMEWQRRERIQAARTLLIGAAPSETVTSIAFRLGFSSSAAFATQYKRYFGESPSMTAAMAA